MHALVVERVVGAPKNSLKASPLSSEASCSPGMKRTSLTLSALTISRKRFMRARRSLPSSVVWVRSPVKTMKSGCLARPLTVATAFFSVCSASGFAGPL